MPMMKLTMAARPLAMVPDSDEEKALTAAEIRAAVVTKLENQSGAVRCCAMAPRSALERLACCKTRRAHNNAPVCPDESDDIRANIYILHEAQAHKHIL